MFYSNSWPKNQETDQKKKKKNNGQIKWYKQYIKLTIVLM